MTIEAAESRWQRAALLSGVVYVVVMLAAFAFFATSILPRFAPIDAPPALRAAAVAALGDTLRLGNYLLVLPAPFFLFFLGGLYTAMRRGADRTLAVAALAAGTAMALIWPLGGIVSDIELDIARAGGDVITVSSLDAIAPYSLALSAFARV